MQSPTSGKTVVIVAYKPKPGKEADLLQLTREHVPLLRVEGLATDHPVTACQAKDGGLRVGSGRRGASPLQPRSDEALGALCRCLRYRAAGLVTRSVQYVRILHPYRTLSK